MHVISFNAYKRPRITQSESNTCLIQSRIRSVFPEKQPELIGCPHASAGIVLASGMKPQELPPPASHIVGGDQSPGIKVGFRG